MLDNPLKPASIIEKNESASTTVWITKIDKYSIDPTNSVISAPPKNAFANNIKATITACILRIGSSNLLNVPSFANLRIRDRCKRK